MVAHDLRRVLRTSNHTGRYDKQHQVTLIPSPPDVRAYTSEAPLQRPQPPRRYYASSRLQARCQTVAPGRHRHAIEGNVGRHKYANHQHGSLHTTPALWSTFAATSLAATDILQLQSVLGFLLCGTRSVGPDIVVLWTYSYRSPARLFTFSCCIVLTRPFFGMHGHSHTYLLCYCFSVKAEPIALEGCAGSAVDKVPPACSQPYCASGHDLLSKSSHCQERKRVESQEQMATNTSCKTEKSELMKF
ncbi:hypothetical protein PENSPDRAFT_349437 [Peniophora sp. CONT]|nr:hypothetical protein PENSPDRAFT_349437 [Peniophora sp. CONT]